MSTLICLALAVASVTLFVGYVRRDLERERIASISRQADRALRSIRASRD